MGESRLIVPYLLKHFAIPVIHRSVFFTCQHKTICDMHETIFSGFVTRSEKTDHLLLFSHTKIVTPS